MNKQELAESMAEFLGWEVDEASVGKTYSLRPMYYSPDGTDLRTEMRLHQYIFSPDGFFAVWRQLQKATHFVGLEMYIPPDEDLKGNAHSCKISKVTQEEIFGCGMDEYTALFEAVHKLKTTKEKVLNEQGRAS